MDLPRVSCIMITYNKFKPFKRAIRSFVNQTYKNKELIIVNSGDQKYIDKVKRFLYGEEGICNKKKLDIHHIRVDKATLGELRNIAIEYSTGQYVMVFDDDDIHH